MYDILNNHDGKSIQKIQNEYENKYNYIIDEYFKFLIENEFVFLTENPSLFPKMSLEWYEPFDVNNAILDIENQFYHKKVLHQLAKLNCKNVEIRFFNKKFETSLNEILNYLNIEKSITNSVGLILPYLKNSETLFEKLIRENSRIRYIIIYNSKENIVIDSIRKGSGHLIYSKENISSSKSCGLISNKQFVINTKMFTESQNHNTCLNRKISIDKDGNIKNCPSMAESFGNIKDTTLEEALNHPNFKKYWNINKDQIEVCKDCEFRHICTDCRAFIEEPNNQYSKPLKCGYSPYTNEWEEWSTNPLKQKAIEFYGMQDLVKKNV